jgi:hypothetical protein
MQKTGSRLFAMCVKDRSTIRSKRCPMLRPVPALALGLAVLMLGGCGHHGHDGDDATSASVEMPAADLPAGPPSLAAPPPARDPDADASEQAQSARIAATNDAENALSVAQAAREAAAEAEQQQQGGAVAGNGQNPPAQTTPAQPQ